MNFTPVSALLGGALIGLAASILLIARGRVAGISGIVGGLLEPKRGEVDWRLTFVLGMLSGAAVLALVHPRALHPGATQVPTMVTVLAGLLVGVGTQLGAGCTSGHGVCGISRGSPRSFAATLTFMAAGVASAFVVQHVVLGGGT